MKTDKEPKKKNGKLEKIEEAEERLPLGLSRETLNSIWGVLSLGVAFFIVLAFADLGGPTGEYTKVLSVMLLGWGMYILPLALCILGFAFFRSIHRNVALGAVLGTGLLTLSILGLFHMSAHGDSVIRLERGGYLGYALGYPLYAATGGVATIAILIVLSIVSFLIALDIPIYSLWRRTPEEGTASDNDVVVKQGGDLVKLEEMQPAAVTAKADTEKAAKPKEKTAPEKMQEASRKVVQDAEWKLPPLKLLAAESEQPKSGDISANVGIIKRTLANFGIEVEMGEVSVGPTVTQYTLRPAVGVKLSKIVALQQDLSLALAAHPIRVEAPIPGKALVGIEVPNKKAAVVRLRDLFESEEYKASKSLLPLALGRDVSGFPVISALEKMPHALIAGATGTGKSVALNAVILSLLYRHSPEILKLILVDPKRVELSLYNGIPHLITPVIVETKKVLNALKWAVREMEQRYQKLADVGARDIYSYNEKQIAGEKEIMPFIVIVIDELADLMVQHGKDVEGAIVRLAQMARAVGIHLIVSTQRPSVEVITGLIKANITSRIALQVASGIDSRTILDTSGAEKLLGRGDMLFQSGDSGAKLRRIQCALVTEQEVHDVVAFIKNQARGIEPEVAPDITGGDVRTSDAKPLFDDPTADGDQDMGDDLFHEAKDVVIQAGKASASLLQRRLRVGYARAARLIDLLEQNGIIGPGDGAKPREVFGAAPRSRDQYDDDGTIAESV